MSTQIVQKIDGRVKFSSRRQAKLLKMRLAQPKNQQGKYVCKGKDNVR